MTTDRELLELAAKAVGIPIHVWGAKGSELVADMTDPSNHKLWNPLTDDGDAFRLAAEIGLKVDWNFRTGRDNKPGVGVWLPNDDSAYPPFWTANSRDIFKDARQTIVRVAAHIGSALP